MCKIKVLVVEPQKEPYVKEIDKSFVIEQKIIGGWTDSLTLAMDNVAALLVGNGKYNIFNRVMCNQTGRPIEILCGTILLCHESSNGKEYGSLSDELIEKYKRFFSIDKGNKVFAYH